MEELKEIIYKRMEELESDIRLDYAQIKHYEKINKKHAEFWQTQLEIREGKVEELLNIIKEINIKLGIIRS
nr:hypothetical protein [Clostridioides sp.]